MKTTAALFVAALVVLGACSDDDDEAADTTIVVAAPTSTRPATTTTERPTTTARSTTTSRPEDDETTDVTDSTDDEATDTTDDETSTDATDGDETTDATTIEDRLTTIEDALKDGDFSLMLEALNLSGLADEIDQKAVTILAPTDEAMRKLDVGDYANLLTHPDELRDLLNRYIIDEALTYDELTKRTEVTTVSGETLTVTYEDGVLEVEGGVVTELDNATLSGGNGREVAVFAIDKVLLEDR